MINKNDTRKQDFTPEDAFLIALDDSVAATAQSLHESGLDEATIWDAFRKAAAALNDAASDIEQEGLNVLPVRRFAEQVA